MFYVNTNYSFCPISLHHSIVRKYKPGHTDYDRMESPEHEEYMDTQQIIRDACFARELQYENTLPASPSTTDLNKLRQVTRDAVYDRQVDKCEQLGCFEI